MKARTLSELLIVMILSGILLLTLFEGVVLIKRYSLTFYARREEGNTLLQGYRRLESLFFLCDSLRAAEEKVCFYQEEKKLAEARQVDSLWVVNKEGEIDTLFRRVSAYRVEKDSLYLFLQIGSRKTALYFGIRKNRER